MSVSAIGRLNFFYDVSSGTWPEPGCLSILRADGSDHYFFSGYCLQATQKNVAFTLPCYVIISSDGGIMLSNRIRRKIRETIGANLKNMVLAGAWLGFFAGIAFTYANNLFAKLVGLPSVAFVQKLFDIVIHIAAFSIVSSTGLMLIALIVFGSIGFVLGLIKAD